MLAFFQTVFTFYHQGYELAKDFDHYKRALAINIQNVRNINVFSSYFYQNNRNDVSFYSFFIDILYVTVTKLQRVTCFEVIFGLLTFTELVNRLKFVLKKITCNVLCRKPSF